LSQRDLGGDRPEVGRFQQKWVFRREKFVHLPDCGKAVAESLFVCPFEFIATVSNIRVKNLVWRCF
jgi:hypothetical protein